MTENSDLQAVFKLNREGVSLHHQYMPQKAINVYKQALEIQPRNPSVLSNLGSAFQATGQLEEALKAFRKAIAIDSNHAQAHYNLGSCLLLCGEIEEGFKEYEWRWHNADIPDEKRWKGQPFIGKTLLISTEQGFGDTIQFIRLVKLAKERGGKVAVIVQAKLGRLLCGANGIDMLIPDGAPLPHFDYFAPLMSLPKLLELTANNIPSEPYIEAEPELIATWEKRLNKKKGFKVGVAWQGNIKVDKDRFLMLENFAPLAKIPSVKLISLQAGEGSEQIADVPFLNIEDLRDEFDAGEDAFIVSVAVMKKLDLVITVDTAIAHLAGALGCMTWVVLKAVPNWRWQMEKEDTLWYENMKLFRQEKANDWDNVIKRITEELAQIV